MRVGSINPGKQLVALRKEKNVNQKVFAEMLGIETSKYNKWENGTSLPNYEEICKLAYKLEVTVDYLLSHSDSRTHRNEKIVDRYGLSEASANRLGRWKESLHMLVSLEYPTLGAQNLAIISTLIEDEQALGLLRAYFFDPITSQGKSYTYIKAYTSHMPDNWKSIKDKDIPIEKWEFPTKHWPSLLFGMIQDKMQRMRETIRERVQGE